MSRCGSSKVHLSWLWRAPRRALGAARDLYVRSLTGCAGRLPGDAAFGCPTFGGVAEYSFVSASSSRRSVGGGGDDDLRELVRAASQRRAPQAVPRSQSVAMARIDEDRPCEFGAGGEAFLLQLLPRSRSCAAGRIRRGGRVASLQAAC